MDITSPRFTDETAARKHLESLRWPQGPFCPHCGSFDATALRARSIAPVWSSAMTAVSNTPSQSAPCSNAQRFRSTSGCSPTICCAPQRRA
ncbi:MAG: transposase [Sphingomonadales bacterium]|nr:transposase [Sphingomonadales bacterium]